MKRRALAWFALSGILLGMVACGQDAVLPTETATMAQVAAPRGAATAIPPTDMPPTPTSAPTSAPEPSTAPVRFVDSGQRLGSACSWDVSLGDVDGDGDLDAFVANSVQSDISSAVWLNDGQGAFTVSEQSLGYGMAVELGDLDGDEDLDAFVVHGKLGRISGGGVPNEVWLNETIIPPTASTTFAASSPADRSSSASPGHPLRVARPSLPANGEAWFIGGIASWSPAACGKRVASCGGEYGQPHVGATIVWMVP